jgi:transposase
METDRVFDTAIPPRKLGADKRIVVIREVVNGLMCILSTGCQRRAIPKNLPPKSTVCVYQQAITTAYAKQRSVHTFHFPERWKYRKSGAG